MSPRRAVGGFTLVEVMVALVVAVLGLVAIAGTGARVIDNAYNYQRGTFALYVGMNVITEFRLRREFPELRESKDTVELAGQEWLWVARVSETEVESLRRLDVDVYRTEEPDKPVRTIIGFVGQPGQVASPSSIWQGLEGEVR